MARRLLLLSSSTVSGGGYLDYAADELRDFLGAVRTVLFVPFALHDRDAYTARVGERLGALGYAVAGLHHADSKREAIGQAEAIFVGGGNTFRLLQTLEDLDLLPAIRARVEAAVPYLGSSAGSNLAGPTIRTTNDMPIVQPRSFEALGLVPFQINPHYLDADPASTHMGETREERIQQFLEENETPVLGLREGASVRVEGDRCTLGGAAGARWFRRGYPAEEVVSGSSYAGPSAAWRKSNGD